MAPETTTDENKASEPSFERAPEGAFFVLWERRSPVRQSEGRRRAKDAALGCGGPRKKVFWVLVFGNPKRAILFFGIKIAKELDRTGVRRSQETG